MTPVVSWDSLEPEVQLTLSLFFKYGHDLPILTFLKPILHRHDTVG